MKQTIIIFIALLLSIGVGESQTSIPIPVPISHESGRINGVQFSDDSTQILSWGGGSVRLWDVTTGELLIDIPSPSQFYSDQSVSVIEWNQDNRQVTVSYLMSSSRYDVLTWDMNTLKIIETSSISTGLMVSDVDPDWLSESANKDNTRIASWDQSSECSDECRRLLTITDADGQQITLQHDANIKDAYWSSNENYLAVTTIPRCADGENCTSDIVVWSINRDANDYGEIVGIAEASCIVWNIQWAQDENTFFTRSDGWWRAAFAGGIDNCEAVWQAFSINGNQILEYSYEPESRSTLSIHLSEDETYITIGFLPINLNLEPGYFTYIFQKLDVANGELIDSLLIDELIIQQDSNLGLNQGIQIINNRLTIWNLNELEMLAEFSLEQPSEPLQNSLSTYYNIEQYSDFKLMVIRTSDDGIYILDMETWELLFEIERGYIVTEYYINREIDDGNMRIYSIDENCSESCLNISAELLDLTTKEILFSFMGESDESIRNLLQLTDSKLIYFTKSCLECDNTFVVYDMQTEEIIIQNTTQQAFRFEDSGETWVLIAALSDPSLGYESPDILQLWDLQTGELILEHEAYGYEISPSGNKIIIYGLDYTAIYDFNTGEELTRFSWLPGRRTILAWSPNDKYIVFDAGGTLGDLYNAETGEWLFPNRVG